MHTIAESFRHGLGAEDYDVIGAPWLETCQNMRPALGGLRPYRPVTQPFTCAISWPKPQVYRGRTTTWAFDGSNIYTLNESTWVKTGQDVADYSTGNAIIGFTFGGGHVHVMDAGDIAIFFDGTKMVMYREGWTGIKYRQLASPVVKTGCVSNGRGVWANFDGWPAAWEVIWNALITKDTFEDSLSTNCVAWGVPGGGDWRFWFDPTLAQQGSHYTAAPGDVHGAADPLFLEFWRRNQIGFMPMPWRDEILRVMPIGNDNVVVYSENNVGALVPFTSPAEGARVYGYRHLSSIGTPQRSTIDGDDQSHVFVDSVGELRVINADLSMEVLGYKKHISPLLTDDVCVSFDPSRREAWISDEDACYVLGKHGLSSASQRVTSMVPIGDDLVGCAEFRGVTPDVTAQVKTEVMDLGSRSVKTIKTVSLGMHTAALTTVDVTVCYRRNATSAWKTMASVNPNPEGQVFCDVSGVEFQILVAADNYAAFMLDRIDLTYEVGGRLNLKTSMELA